MGTVYKAVDETLDRRVALKVLNADLLDPDAVERFRREAMMLARLNHGRIGAIHELTREGHDFLMVMEFLEGETIEKLIERGPLAVPRAIQLCSQVLEALEYAHAAGIVHRDLKPANLMVTPSGNVKVMDFGIARVQGSAHLTTNGYMVGTPAYMAPEQVRGEEVDPRMDLYSLAVVLYRMLTHHLPFQGDTAIAMIHSQLNNAPIPAQQLRPDLPEWLAATLERGLAKKPGERFQTAREFRLSLERGLTARMPVVKPQVAAPATRAMPIPMALSDTPGPQSVSLSSVSPDALRPSATSGAARSAPQAADGATVTLRPRHLATIGSLVALLVVGGGVLAFVALRRPTTVVVQPGTVQADAQPVANAQDTQQPAPDGGGTPNSTAPAAEPASPAASSASTPAPQASSPPSVSSGQPGAAPQPPAAPAQGTTAPGGSSSATSTAPARGRASGAAGSGRATSPPAVPDTPAAAEAPTQNFGDVRTMVFEGTKSREVDALLSLEPGTLIVRSKADGAVLRTLPYRTIAAATYARAKRPRGQSVSGAASVPGDVGGAGLFGGARHWLTLQTADEFVIIRLEDRNVIPVLNGLEARTGTKILRTQGN
jgi:serine/threonine protein kinase